MASVRPIRWLHLSDLHLGCRGQEIWWQVREEFEKSVRAWVGEHWAPDLVLFSGDLTFRGAAEEFDQIDRFLDGFLGWIREAAPRAAEPLLLAVPGNHDLVRPEGRAAWTYRVLDRLLAGGEDADVQQLQRDLWEAGDASFIADLFHPYTAWWERRIRPGLAKPGMVTPHASYFPGDFTAEIALPGVCPLAVVGLNSTWQQYRAGEDFEGRLHLPLRQFQAALPSDGKGAPLAIFKRHPRALLMLHQPPSWLSKAGQKELYESIYPPDRFDLCLFGHLHEARSESFAISGGRPRFLYQSPSLFGLEHYGRRNEVRAIGYTWGSLGEDGDLRLWPFRRWIQGGGEAVFVRDPDFPQDAEGVALKASFGASRSAAAPPPDFGSYLTDLIARTDHLKITGVARAGESKAALRQPIEKLYTPLSTRNEERGLTVGGAERVTLADLLPRHRRLLLEGQPGAGKTTFLRLLACLLARDVQGVACPDGRSWRERYLGLEGDRPPLPILLRAADLLRVLPSDASFRRDDQRLFLDLLDLLTQENGFAIPRDSWERLLQGKLAGQEALLLVDGLDEVAEEGTRERVLEAFRAAETAWPVPLVVTSRPFDTASLRYLGFHVAVVEPFGEKEVETFLAHWIEALYGEEGTASRRAEGDEYRRALREAICQRSAIRRLATNPVMLTCLCVIHWNEQRLPEGRARVYRAVLRWLLLARTEQRKERGFTDYFAERAFARLALAMMDTPSGKVSLLDLERAAEAVDGVATRDFPDLAVEDRRRKAREWLRYECLGSGIIEEVGGHRLRFWHLTFQEFLAALQLAWRGDGESATEDWWPVVEKRLADAQWRETVELLPGCLLDEGGEGRVDRLLSRVLGLLGQAPSLAEEARVAGIVSRLQQPLTGYGYLPRSEITAVYGRALERSLAVFTPEGASQVPIQDRISAAEALGRGGDPRLLPERDNFLEVPSLSGVRLGKYLVTVEEYQRFVESRGYEEHRYWDETGWKQREEGEWEAPDEWEGQLETPNRPVVGVSWYEASAYCRWQSELHRYEVRLPTELEWEKAATPEHGKFPWGKKEPDAERANFKRNVGAPTPVGLYPAGDGPQGHSDLAGNAWEWCADLVEKPDWRAQRGGCFLNSVELLWADFRYRRPACDRSSLVGFRCAAPAPPSRLAS